MRAMDHLRLKTDTLVNPLELTWADVSAAVETL